VHEPEAGLSNARNRGAQETEADVLLFLDDDVVVTSRALTAYAAAIVRHGAERFYGGPVLPQYEGDGPPDWLLSHLPSSVKGLRFSEVDEEINEPVFLGANFAVPTYGLNGEALFDHLSATGRSGGAVGEETRLQERLLARGVLGYSVIEAAVWHWVPQRNCTPRWAVQRRYRHGYTAGHMEALHEGVTLRPWMLRRLISTAVVAVGTRVSARNAEDRFRASIKHWYLRGYVRGVRDGLREKARGGHAG
jgi:glycosyltransferase involved in cell wall biosynthesis